MYSKNITAIGGVKKTAKKQPQWQFDVWLWNESGTKIKEKHRMNVRRKEEESARSIVRKKYPFPYFVELWNVKK